MKQEPMDYNNPLGISKREWTLVLGVNFALLIMVYLIALICTLCGNTFFMLKGENALADASGLPLSKIHEMCEGDYRMDANEAVSLGFSDSIL